MPAILLYADRPVHDKVPGEIEAKRFWLPANQPSALLGDEVWFGKGVRIGRIALQAFEEHNRRDGRRGQHIIGNVAFWENSPIYLRERTC